MMRLPTATALLVVLLLAASADAYGGGGGRPWWDGAASSETQTHTTTGHFQTQTDRSRERMRGNQGYVPYTPKKDEAEAKRQANAQIAARATVNGGSWHEGSGGRQQPSTNGFTSYTDASRERMMEEAQRRYQEKQRRLQEGQQGW